MIKGWKIFQIYVDSGKLMYVIAIFGEKSIVVDDFQVVEEIRSMSYEEKEIFRKVNGEELPRNFINDLIVFL